MDDKEILARHNSIILTEHSIVQEYEGLGYKELIEIPLKKIDSIRYIKRLNILLIFYGCSFIFMSIIFTFFEIKFQSIDILIKYGFIIFGLFLIIYSLFSSILLLYRNGNQKLLDTMKILNILQMDLY